MNFNVSAFTFLLLVINETGVFGRQIKKRQIYREEVLPHKGGKIPETAFHTDRLALNRLQKEGIAIPDGVLLEQRNPKVHPYVVSDLRPVFKVHHTSDDRYTPTEGQYLHYYEPATAAETTYPIPRITNDALNAPPMTSIFQPIYKPFNLPNPLLKNTPFNPYFKMKTVPSVYTSPQSYVYAQQMAATPHHLNSKFGHYYPKIVSQTKWNYFKDEYDAPQILKDFSSFFNVLDNTIPHY